MLFFFLLTLNAGLYVDADAPCDLVRVRDVLQIGSQYFILDGGDHQVKVTNDRGELLHHFGQKGEGPGEFQFPSSIGVVNGEIWVHDLISSQVQRFTPKGEYLGAHKIAALGPLQFETKHPIIHTPTQARSFIVLNGEFEEVGKVGKGMDATGGIQVDQIVHFLQVFTVDPKDQVLYSIGVNGKSITSYDLKTMRQQSMRELPLGDYAAPQKVEADGGRVRVTGGRPVKGTVFHAGHLFTLVHDEREEDHSRLVVLDTSGNFLQNTKLDTHFTHLFGNPDQGSAFFVNGEESLIEERPLVLQAK